MDSKTSVIFHSAALQPQLHKPRKLEFSPVVLLQSGESYAADKDWDTDSDKGSLKLEASARLAKRHRTADDSFCVVTSKKHTSQLGIQEELDAMPKVSGGRGSSSRPNSARPGSARPSSANSDATSVSVAREKPLPPFKNAEFVKRRAETKRGPRIWKNLKQIIACENYDRVPPNQPTYVNIEAPPSMYPPKKYCDFTGFPAKYTDPKTKLRYASSALYSVIRGLPEYSVQNYLEVRKANVILK